MLKLNAKSTCQPFFWKLDEGTTLYPIFTRSRRVLDPWHRQTDGHSLENRERSTQISPTGTNWLVEERVKVQLWGHIWRSWTNGWRKIAYFPGNRAYRHTDLPVAKRWTPVYRRTTPLFFKPTISFELIPCCVYDYVNFGSAKVELNNHLK